MGADVLSRNTGGAMINQDPNLNAFLHLIRTGEGTLGDDGYRILYGGSHFTGFADHPRIKITAGGITSSAAGAYQILQKTWDGLVKQFPTLMTSFSPECQDEAATLLIKGRGAYADVLAGRFKTAIMKCNKEWASLPLSPYGQPTLTMEKATQILINAGAQFEPAQKQEKNMSLAGSIILGALPNLLNILPELGAVTKVSDKVVPTLELASKIGSILVATTGEQNTQAAVEKVLADPQVATQVNDALRLSRADMIDIINASRDKDEASVGSAREAYVADPFMIDTPWVKLKFAHVLALVIVGVATVLSIDVLSVPATVANAGERTMVMNTWLVIGLAGVIYFWYGSSRGSQIKDEMKQQR